MMELRRKLDKTEMSYQEKLEKVQEKCDKEIGECFPYLEDESCC